MTKRMMMFAAVTGLAMAVSAATRFTVSSGETATIGTDIGNANNGTCELVAEAGSTVVLPAAEGVNCWVYTRLYLTGSGTVTLVAPPGDFSAPTVVFANGLAAESDNVTLHVGIAGVTSLKVGRSRSAPTDISYPPADIANVAFANANGIFVLCDDVTVLKLPSAYAVDSGACLALFGTNPLRLGETFSLTNYDVVLLSSGAIPALCKVTVNPGRTLAFKPCHMINDNDNWSYTWYWEGENAASGQFQVILNGKGSRVLCRNSNQKQLRLLAKITGVGEIVLYPDAEPLTPTFYKGLTWRARNSTPVAIPVNTAAEPPPNSAAQHSWTNKVAHWFDASDANTIVRYTRTSTSLRNKFQGQYPIIVGWLDHIKGHTDTFFYSRDAQNNHVPYDLPYLVEGGLNGKDYLSFGEYYSYIDMNQVDAQDCPATAHIRRWIQFVKASSGNVTGNAKPDGTSGSYTTVTDCKYCIMVFGSQYGGGKSILGCQKDMKSPKTTGDMARNSSLISQAWFAYSGYSITVDGAPVNTTDRPNGSWQIVSVDMSATNTVLDCLGGCRVTRSDAGLAANNRDFTLTGGQNYAEVLFFDEVPTDDERAACERYLAEKWGLTASYNNWDASFVEFSGGQDRIILFSDVNKPNRTGASEITVAGNFMGTFDVPAGKTLVVSDRPAPPAPYDIPQQGSLVAWFDPSLDGAIDFHEHPDAATGVARLYSRTASGVDKTDGAYWMGMNALAKDDALTGTGIGNKYGRYPFLTSTCYPAASGIGTSMPWMDFTQNVSGDGNGNTLRSHQLPLTGNEINDATATPMTFRSLFMALDTSAGGGNPVGDNVKFNKGIRKRASDGKDYKKPIWSTGTMEMAHTWLDTNEVNGATTGYSGRAEVLGFETAADFTTDAGLFFGYYNNSDDGREYYGNGEHIGETLVYGTALTDAERLTVQEYLMAKWTGDMNGKYSDLSRATVTGAGNVYSASLRNLPTFGAGFTGTLAGGSNMTFTVDSSWNAAAAVDALTVERAVTIDAACAVKVTLRGKAKAGVYTLLTVPSGAMAGKTFALTLVNETGKGAPAKLVTSDTTLSIEILSQGTVLMVR